MTTSAETPCDILDYKHICSRHTLLLSGGQVIGRGEAALDIFEYLRRTQEVTP